MAIKDNNMKVTLINKEEIKNFISNHGYVACICYDTNPKYAKAVGKSVLESNHMSGSRGDFFKFEFQNVPRSLIDESVRHEIGSFKNVQSFRYVKMDDFKYYTPTIIQKYPNIERVYDETMQVIQTNYNKILAMLGEEGYTGEQANQSARGIIPMNTNSAFIQGFTAEALFNFMNKRLCVRADEPIRRIAEMMKKAILEIIPEFEPYLVPTCEKLMYCTESKHCCGRYLTQQQMEQFLNTPDILEKMNDYKKLNKKGIK